MENPSNVDRLCTLTAGNTNKLEGTSVAPSRESTAFPFVFTAACSPWPAVNVFESQFSGKPEAEGPKISLHDIDKDTVSFEPAARSLATTIHRMEREGKGPYDAPYTGLMEHSAAFVTQDHQKDEDGGNGQQRTSLLILRQTALNLAIAAGRLDIVSLMVGPEDEGLGEIEKEKEEEILCAATHLGWNPCFTTTDNDEVLDAAKREYPILSCFLTLRNFFGANAFLPDGREPRLRLPVSLIGWTRGSVTAVTSLNALHRACFHNRPAIVRYLVEACWMCVDDPTVYGSSDAHPVFAFFYSVHFAAIAATRTGDLSVLRYLIEERKCDKDARVFTRVAEQVKSVGHFVSPAQTALHHVCAFRDSIIPPPHYEHRHSTYSRLVVRYLLRAGLEGLAETSAGETPFSLAVTSAKSCAEEKFREHYHEAIRANAGGFVSFFPNADEGSVEDKEVKRSMALVRTLLSRHPWVCPLHRAYFPIVFEESDCSSALTLTCPPVFTNEMSLSPLPVETFGELQGKQPTELLELLLSYGAVPLSAEESAHLLHFTSPRHCQLMMDHGIDLMGSAERDLESKEEITFALRTAVQNNRPDPNREDPLTGQTVRE